MCSSLCFYPNDVLKRFELIYDHTIKIHSLIIIKTTMHFILILLSWILGICTMGYPLTEHGWMLLLSTSAPWIWFATLICFLLNYLQVRFKRPQNFSFITLALLCLSIFLLGQYFAERQLQHRLQQRIQAVKQSSKLIYVNKIDERSNAQEKNRLKQQVQWLSHGRDDQQNILLYLPEHLQQMGLVLGQYYRVTGNLKPAHSYAVAHVFDQEKWLLQQNIMGTMQVKQIEPISIQNLKQLGYSQVIQHNSSLISTFKLTAERKRLEFRILLLQQPLENKGLLLALLTGDESLLSEQTKNQFKTLGISHLLAISGPHVLIFAVIFCFIFNLIISKFLPQIFLKIPRPYLLIVPFVSCVIVYTTFVGFEIPAMRTCLTVCLLGFMLIIRQQINTLKLLLLSASILLLIDPFSILSTAFWLSYGACFILIRVYQTIIQQSTHENIEQQGVESLRYKFKMLLRVLIESQWKVFIALFPLVALIFGQVSWIAPLINLIAIPLIGAVIVPLEVIGALLGQLISPLGLIFFHLADFSASFLLGIFNILSDLFKPSLSWLAFSPLMILCLTIGIVILFLPRGTVPKLWAVLCFLPLLWGINSQREFSFTILDIGQGQALFLNTQNYKMMIDTGGSFDENQFSIAQNILLPYLMGEGIHRLDHVLLTHLDQDHAGAFEKLNQVVQINQVSSNQRDLRFQNSNFRYCHAGQQWNLEGVKIQVLAPLENQLYNVAEQQNELSCIVYIQVLKSTGFQHFLMMGDAGWEAEYRLMQHYPDLKVDVLILGHHGSQHSSSYAFLKHYQPKLAIASAGFNNRYGHPHPLTQARLKALSIPFETTIQQGSISFELQSDGEMREKHHRHTRTWLMR